MRDLKDVQASELACVQLMGDPLWNRLGAGDVRRLVRASLELGEREAGRLGPADPEAELARRGFVIKWEAGASPGSRPGYHLCALTTWDGQTGVVTVYRDEIAAKARSLAGKALGVPDAPGTSDAPSASEAPVTYGSLLRLHLLHELYHAIEFSTGRLTPDVVGTVRVPGLFGGRARRVSTTSELAAHAFARAECGQALSPWLVDLEYLLAEGSLAPQTLDERLAQAHDLLREED